MAMQGEAVRAGRLAPAATTRRRFDAAALGWALFGLLSYTVVPWNFLQDQTLWEALPGLLASGKASSGLMQSVALGNHGLLAGLVGLLVALAFALAGPGRRQGLVVVGCAVLGIASVLFGHPPAADAAAAPVAAGLGWGGFGALTAFVMLAGCGVSRMGLFAADTFVACAVVGISALLILFVAFPVGRIMLAALVDEAGDLSFPALAHRLFTERIWGFGCVSGAGTACGVAWNTLFLALISATGTTLLGAMMALMAARGSARWKRPLNALALLPIVTPPFVVGLGLILLLGRAGLVNQGLAWAFGIAPTRWFYGLPGLVITQLFAFTPIAFLIIRGVVQGISPSLEEAAQTLRASRTRTFLSVTLPLLAPGLANAFLVGFVESMADFGNPIVVGGDYSVLSTEVFFAIVGAQLDRGKAAALALVLTALALSVFGVQRRLLGKRNFTTFSGKGDAGLPMPLPASVRRICAGIAGPWLVFTSVVYLFALTGGFVKTWGRDYTLTLSHYAAFKMQWSDWHPALTGAAWPSLLTTLELAAIAAPLCATLGLMISWLLSRTSFRGRNFFEFSSLMVFAIPGTVLGVSYVLAFNVPPFELTGTGVIIVLCFVFRNLPVGVRAGTASLQQIDRSLDEASLMLRANTPTTLRRVILPLLKPALVASLVYSFVRSITTVSAVIFLVTADTDLATTYIIGRAGNSDYGGALAYCTVLILSMSLVTLVIQRLVGERNVGRRLSES